MSDKAEKSEKKRSIQEAIQQQFIEQRKVFLWGQFTSKTCKAWLDQILFLDFKNPGQEIVLFLNSPGGSVTDGLALFDAIKMIRSPIATVVVGMAASMGSILLCSGKKGRRFIYPHGRVMIHQPHIAGQFEAPAVDIGIHAREVEKQRTELNNILATASGQPYARIEKDSDRDFYMTAQESVDYGLVDEIIIDANHYSHLKI